MPMLFCTNLLDRKIMMNPNKWNYLSVHSDCNSYLPQTLVRSRWSQRTWPHSYSCQSQTLFQSYHWTAEAPPTGAGWTAAVWSRMAESSEAEWWSQRSSHSRRWHSVQQLENVTWLIYRVSTKKGTLSSMALQSQSTFFCGHPVFFFNLNGQYST